MEKRENENFEGNEPNKVARIDLNAGPASAQHAPNAASQPEPIPIIPHTVVPRQKTKEEREKERQERELKREKERQERELLKKLKEEERERERLRKEEVKRQREEEKRQKDEEKRQREEEKRLKILQKEQEAARIAAEIASKEAQQPKLNSFFRVVQKPVVQERQEPKATNDFDNTFLSFHLKAGHQIYRPELARESPEDMLGWLKNQKSYVPPKTIGCAELKKALNSGRDAELLLKQLQLKHIQLWETTRPTFVGTAEDIEPEALLKACINPKHRVLDLSYDYDSDLEWAPGDEDDEDLEDDEASDDDGDVLSDAESFVENDDEEGSKKRIIRAVDPVIMSNDHSDDFFAQFAAKIFTPNLPMEIGEYNAKSSSTSVAESDPLAPETSASKAPPVDIPDEALRAMLAKVHGFEGTKAFLLEVLSHEMRGKYKTLTRPIIKQVIEKNARAKRDKDKQVWQVHAHMHSLIENSGQPIVAESLPQKGSDSAPPPVTAFFNAGPKSN